MKDTKKIEELLEQSKRSKLEIDLKHESNYDDITHKLEHERVLDFGHFTADDIKVVNMEEEMKDFDYFNIEPETTTNEKVSEDDVVKSPKKEKQLTDVDKRNLDNYEELINKKDTSNEEFTIDVSELSQKDVSSNLPIIEYKDVKLKIDRDDIIKGVSLKIFPGEFVYFVGKSGAGKSSLAKMIYKEVKNTGGSLIVDETNVTNLRSSKLPHLRRKIGVIFQDFKLLNEKTVYENVKYSLDVTGYPKKEKKEQVLKILKIVGVLDQKDKYPNELSGGQQQRVAIARAIVDDPKIIVADEPTGNLDPQNALAVMEILKKINKTGTTIVMATHDVGIVNKYKNRVILFENGVIENESKGGYIYE